MHENVKKKVKDAKQNRIRRRHTYAVLAICSIMVAAFVSWQLILPGIAQSGEPKCGMTEHIHSEDCYGDVLVCGQEEWETHTHGDACYTQVTSGEPTCGLEESAGHVHGEGCYTSQLTCTLPEDENHTHGETCYTSSLTCGQEEGAGAHTHSDACYETVSQLTCTLPEGEGHSHTETCYGKGADLTCGLEEHTHTLACYSDPAADVEDEAAWTGAFSSVTMDGDWGAQAAAIARTQINYSESGNNYQVAQDGVTKLGYTRYGAWAGDAYGDWNTYFAAFCMTYAQVPETVFPVDKDLNVWLQKLRASQYYGDASSAEPKEGDLVILTKDQITSVGILTGIDDTSIKVVEGDCDGVVRENTYAPSSSEITGYGLLSAAQASYYGTDDSTDDATAGAEEELQSEAVEGQQDGEDGSDGSDASQGGEGRQEGEEQPDSEAPSEGEDQLDGEEQPEDGDQPDSEASSEDEYQPDSENPSEGEELQGGEVSGNGQDPENTVDGTEENVGGAAAEGPNDIFFSAQENELINPGIMLMSIPEGGYDLGKHPDNIISLSTEKVVNGIWQSATEFHDGDSIRVTINYQLPANELSENNKVIYYQLPEGVWPTGELDGEVKYIGSGGDEDAVYGTYTIGTDGLITITFNDIMSVGTLFVGTVQYTGTVKADEIDSGGSITFDGVDKTITISTEEETNTDLKVEKTVDDYGIDYDGDDKEYYVEYIIKVSSQTGTNGNPVNVTDIITSNFPVDDVPNWAFKINGTQWIDYQPDHTSVGRTDYEGDETKGFSLTNLPALGPGEEITIEYRIEGKVPRDENLGADNIEEGYAHNNVTAQSGDNSVTANASVNFHNKLVTKSGEYINGGKDIAWTIKINEDRIDLQGYEIRDGWNGNYDWEWPADNGIEIQIQSDQHPKDVKIYNQWPIRFTESTTDSYTITYTTPAWLYEDEDYSCNGVEIWKDEEFIDSDWVEMRPSGTGYVAVTKYTHEENPPEYIDETTTKLWWQVEFSIPVGYVGDVTYTDTITISDGNIEGTTQHYGIAAEIEASIANHHDGFARDENDVAESTYEIKYFGFDNQEIAEDDWKTPVAWFEMTITYIEPVIGGAGAQHDYTWMMYPTRAVHGSSEDNVATGTTIYRNDGTVELDDGRSDEDDAEAAYTDGMRLEKQVQDPGSNDGAYFSDDISIGYDQTNGVINYRLIIRTKPEDREAISVTDELPNGLTYVEDSVRVVFYSDELGEYDTINENDDDAYSISKNIQDYSSGQKISVGIEDGYNDDSVGRNQGNIIIIYYQASIDEFNSENASNMEENISYTNTASYTIGNSEASWSDSQTTTVVKKLLDKSGVYDSDKRQVSYTIKINEKEEDLSETDTLILRDQMSLPNGVTVSSLDSVTLTY